jgi:hypothetical protein
MGNALLVNIDLDRGAQMLRILDEAGLKVSVAAWVHLEEYTDWRFLLCSRQFDALDLPNAFGLLNRTLDSGGFPLEKKPPTLILPMSDPFVRALRRIFRKPASVEGMRIGGQQIGNRWVEDGYAYRIS